MSFHNVSNNSESVLASAVGVSDLTITVTEDNFPPTPFYITLGSNTSNEIVEVTLKNGNIFTIGRAKDGTTAKEFIIGDKVQLFMVAGLLTEIQNAIPTSLSELSDDSTHRLVSDTEKTNWDSNVYSTTLKSTYQALTDGVTNIPIGVSYSQATDSLMVSYMGVELFENENFTLGVDGISIDLTGWSINTEEKIYFAVLKKIVDVDDLVSGSQLNDLSIEKIKLSQGLQDEINSKVEQSDYLQKMKRLQMGVRR